MATRTSAWALACALSAVGVVGVVGVVGMTAPAHAQAQAQAQDAAAQKPPGQPAQAAKPATSAPALVFTRATVHSVFTEDGGRRQYIRLKLGPGSGLPFRTQTFRVRDAALVADHPPGSSVAFVARRVDGENTLTALRGAPKIQRFEVH